MMDYKHDIDEQKVPEVDISHLVPSEEEYE
jgi:hypothetical protein